MKKYLVICLLLFCPFAMAEEITLEWDLPAEGDRPDGYRIFQANPVLTDAGWVTTFDYTQPVTTDTYPDGNIPGDVGELVFDVPGKPEEVLQYLWVARAFKGGKESTDSNTVTYKVVNTVPPAPVDLAGGYNEDTGMITVSWSQPADKHIVNHWIVYYRIADGEYKAIARIGRDHELTIDAPISAIDLGPEKEIRFVVVSYRRSGVYSENSQELIIQVALEDVNPVQNLRFSVDIPVE